MNSRKAAREALATLLDNGIATLQTVYDRETLDFGNLSPVATVHSDGTGPGPGLSLGVYQRQHAFIVTIYWLWTETTEDDMDDLSEDVFDFLEANGASNGTWSSLTYDENFSATGYETLDGVVYRIEQIRVIVW
jgi:hypothetical protein